jgi:hypothetical protein
MWQRQLEWRLLFPIAQVVRHSHPKMAEMENPQVPDWAAVNQPRALHAMAIVDEALRGRPFIAGDRFTALPTSRELVALPVSPIRADCNPARAGSPQSLARGP